MTGNKVEHLAAMLGHGGKARIAEMCQVHPAIITRWVKRNGIPAKYNARMMRGLRRHAEWHDSDWFVHAVSLLEPDECPTCQRPLEMHK